jgi:hypothetical protein
MFRFTIRDLMWMMVVVALGVAWGLDYRDMCGYAVREALWREAELRYHAQLVQIGAVPDPLAPSPKRPKD